VSKALENYFKFCKNSLVAVVHAGLSEDKFMHPVLPSGYKMTPGNDFYFFRYSS